MSSTDDVICKICDNIYGIKGQRWCKSCQINDLKQNFKNWTSENEKIDELIREMQLKIRSHNDIIVEWVPYNQFNNIKRIYKDDFTILYSAVWKDGLLAYDDNKMEYKRKHNKAVVLKCLYNSQNITNEILNEVKLYNINGFMYDILKIYGITQNPDTNNYILVLQDGFCECCGKIYTNIACEFCRPCYLKINFTNCVSGNEKIDELIQEMQLKIKNYNDIIFEWISYNQFSNIKEIYKDESSALYSAIWISGPLKCDEYHEMKQKREPNKEVTLKYLYNSQYITNEFLNEVRLYRIQDDNDSVFIYGISQNPDTKDYIIVLSDSYCKKCGNQYANLYNNWCKVCQINNLKQNFANWTSRNESIDKFIQEMQLKINKWYDNKVVEWISYNQFNDIKEIYKNESTTLYSAMWMDGPLKYSNKKWKRVPNKKVTLKCLYNPQDITNEFMSKDRLYGISQNPDTNDYIIVLIDDCFCKNCGVIYTSEWCDIWCKTCQINNLKENFANWNSGNGNIDNFIKDMQLKINEYNSIIVEWIPYDQFNHIKEIGKGGFATVYSAIWTNGPLVYDDNKMEYKRKHNKAVALKCLYNSQNITNEFLNEIKKYSIDWDDHIIHLYGISQNPDTKDYIMVLEYAEGGNLNDYVKNNIVDWSWYERMRALHNIINGLIKVHENKMVHRDFHTGNILSIPSGYIANVNKPIIDLYISDMGLCGEASNVDETKIYGVMPFIAPEVLRGNSYEQAADVYSFGMLMYFVATTKQPFANCAHDHFLALDICDGIRPIINEEVPKCYIDLMKRCWDSNSDNRPSAIEIEKLIKLFKDKTYEILYEKNYDDDDEIKKQFEEAEEYRKADLLSTKRNKPITTHSQAYYFSRLLNSYTYELSKYDDGKDIYFINESLESEEQYLIH